MNRTSRGCRLVKSAARSPARWMTGPEVARKPDPHLARDDLRQGRLAEPRRPEKQHVVERFAARFGGLDEDAQIVAQLALADELVEGQRPDRGLGGVLLGAFGGDDARRGLAHTATALMAASSCSPARISASTAAPLPSRRDAVGDRAKGLGAADCRD